MILPRPLSRQRGASIFTMLVLAIIVGFLMLMGARTFPALNEYLTIRKVVGQIMRNNPASADAIRQAFDKSAEVEYAIHTIAGKDLQIKPLGDAGFRTSYAYNVEIPIAEPAFLLLKFDGSASSADVKGP
jgi:hypothetical protein